MLFREILMPSEHSLSMAEERIPARDRVAQKAPSVKGFMRRA